MSTSPAPTRPGRRWPVVAILLIGLGLAVAPVAFQMFSRVPPGGQMLDDFAPHMHDDQISGFRDDLAEIEAGRGEAEALIAADPARYPGVTTFVADYPAIHEDMASMLTTMEHNIGNYEGVAALPPFVLFPWFFVIPGLVTAAVAGWVLRADAGRAPSRGRSIALVALAVGLVAAPAVFQMFSRAPGGAEMIDDFKPFMQPAKVAKVQGYFLTIGSGEGELRRAVLPDLEAAGGRPPTPAIDAFAADWPEISNGLAPMLGTMADNVDRFAGLAALPPFSLFPWFFVLPGLLIGALLWVARRPSSLAATVAVSSPEPALEGA
jgi:hypothetical protein